MLQHYGPILVYLKTMGKLEQCFLTFFQPWHPLKLFYILKYLGLKF